MTPDPIPRRKPERHLEKKVTNEIPTKKRTISVKKKIREGEKKEKILT
jgi:hypothetical protein